MLSNGFLEPTSAPTDITIIPIVETPTSVEITWQPPQKSNGDITGFYIGLYLFERFLHEAILGYFLFYSTIPSKDISKWVPCPVMGDKLSDVVTGLTLNTKYHFKIESRNSMGYGPYSEIVSYTTRPGPMVKEGKDKKNKEI